MSTTAEELAKWHEAMAAEPKRNEGKRKRHADTAQELRRLAAEVEAQRKWINEAIQPLGLYQAYGWSDRMGVIARGRKLLENPHG